MLPPPTRRWRIGVAVHGYHLRLVEPTALYRRIAFPLIVGSMNTILLLLLSNVFMTVAWYGHLKFGHDIPLWKVILISWGIAFFEYCLAVPANRLGYGQFSGFQLKIMQEVITLAVFVPFAVVYLKEPFKLDYLWAALCMVGAVYFIFRSG